MDVRDKGIVVTGAGCGIGQALARRLVAEGARVVVNDIDAAAASATAEAIGGYAIPGDVATESGTSALVDAALKQLRTIDVYFANAGIIGGSGLASTTDEWIRTFDVNVMAHVWAAQRLVPLWLASGSGRFVVTGSAAGLLTMLGSAQYSVTKHAAVAFAEWLSATYGDRGITVQVVCPQGVNTQLLDSAESVREVVGRDSLLEPEQVADSVWEALGDDRFLILPHPEVQRYYEYRATNTDGWLAGMRRLQAQFDAPKEQP